MATLQHPASLNVLQQFGQACSILRNTTRASNPAWYQEALDLDFQLHLRADGATLSTFYFDRRKNQWTNGPSLAEDTLLNPTRLEPAIAEALRHSRANGATSLGVILHIADEFATTELKPELDNPAALPELRDAAISDPATILADSSIQADQASWRVLPYSASGSEVIGTTITLSRQYAPFVEALRQLSEKENFPIITHALSAPLVAIMGLCRLVTPTQGRPFVAILQYPWLTALAFFNEHADLRLIRTLQHRGLRRPTNFRNALATTNASLEFIDPDLFILPLAQSVDNTLDADMKITFNTSRVEVIQPVLLEGIPSWCPEPAISILAANADGAKVSSHTFSSLREEKWALQNFLPVPKEILEIYPTRSEMKLLRVLRLSRVALFAIAVLSLAYIAFGIIDLIRRPEWAFDPGSAEAAKSKLVKYTQERQRTDQWGNLLDDRSKAWASMESLALMFPKNGGMLVKTYSHSVKPETGAGKTAVGFIKEWKITGFARDEALDYLNTINTREGIAAHFSEVTRTTGNPAYDPTIGNRNLVVNVRTQENSSYKSAPPEEALLADESTYPFTFDLTITQRFEATDPMAISVTAATGKAKPGARK